MASSPVTAAAVDPTLLRAANLIQLFPLLPDPRDPRGLRHRLDVILALMLAAVAGGAKSVAAIWEFAADVGARQVLQLRRTTTVKGKRSVEVVYLICSKPMTDAQPSRVADWVRGHWGIEDRLHYVRDVTFDEDRSRVRTGAGAENMATLRNIAISIHRLAHATNIAAALRAAARRLKRVINLLLTS